jgi:hypothetical protein
VRITLCSIYTRCWLDRRAARHSFKISTLAGNHAWICSSNKSWGISNFGFSFFLSDELKNTEILKKCAPYIGLL